uniref:Glyco_hydro_57 domain-containing protein n=1 Tax=Caenorhabditis tropicalis TaxID=1561998 RepID=A0A1I7V0R2_9PELO
MYYHWAYQRYPDTVAEYVKSEIALFSISPEEPLFAEKLKKNVLKKIKYVYDQRILYCEEIAETPYQEYKEFGHHIFNCVFRNGSAG